MHQLDHHYHLNRSENKINCQFMIFCITMFRKKTKVWTPFQLPAFIMTVFLNQSRQIVNCMPRMRDNPSSVSPKNVLSDWTQIRWSGSDKGFGGWKPQDWWSPSWRLSSWAIVEAWRIYTLTHQNLKCLFFVDLASDHAQSSLVYANNWRVYI